jgi:hypothetical protein
VIIQLVRLRYMLMWARMRGKPGSFLVLVVLILLISFLLLNSGFLGMLLGLILACEKNFTQTIHLIFLVLFFSPYFLTIMLWGRTQPLFSETILLRYPIPATIRFAARHIIGILDPLWLAQTLFVVGLIAVLVSKNLVAPFNALICTPLFVSVSYLSASASLALISRATLHSRSHSLLCLAGLGLFTTSIIAASFLKKSVSILNSPALEFLPSAAATHLLLEKSAVAFICYGVILAGWSFLSAGLLKRLEASSPSLSNRNPGRWETRIARVFASLFAGPWSPLIERSLLYHLRCNRVRINLAITIPAIMLMLHFMDRSLNPAEMLLIRLALLFVSGLFSVSTMMFNAYGYDGGGLLRLALYPIPFASTLYCANLASLVLSLTVGSSASLFVGTMRGLPIDPRAFLMLLLAACAGSFFLAALGLFSSTYMPTRAQFDRVFGGDTSPQTRGMICAIMFCSLLTAFQLSNASKTSQPTQFWWAFLMLLVFCVCLFIFSLRRVGRIIITKREDLLIDLCNK